MLLAYAIIAAVNIELYLSWRNRRRRRLASCSRDGAGRHVPDSSRGLGWTHHVAQQRSDLAKAGDADQRDHQTAVLGGAYTANTERQRKYPTLDGRIEQTYAERSTAQLKNSLCTTRKIRAFRWATDRIGDKCGCCRIRLQWWAI